MQRKLFLLSGVAFVALVLATVIGIGGSTPGSDASGEKLASFYGDHALRQGAVSFVLALAGLLVVLFGVGVAMEAERSTWRHVLLIGTGLVSASAILTAFIHFALANGGDEKVSPAAMQALNSLDANTWVFFNTAFGVMLLGAAGVILSGTAVRWLGWIALVIGIAIFIPFVDFFALLATLVWIAIAGVVLSRTEAAPAIVAAPGAA